jgi:hypothetical protein
MQQRGEPCLDVDGELEQAAEQRLEDNGGLTEQDS